MKVNLSFDLPYEEQRRVCLEFLKAHYALGYTWEGSDVVDYEPYYHGSGEHRVVIGKVSDSMRNAKQVYLELLKESVK